MAVTWKVREQKRLDVYLFDPAEITIKAELNGRYDAHDDEKMEELIQSILDNGQLEPVLVRQESGKPILTAGFRRWTAISLINKRKLAPGGLRLKIECRYVRCNEVEGFFLNYEENHKREQTSPMDDAHHFAQLERWGWDAKGIAEKLHVKPQFVKDRLALIEAIPSVQAAVASGKVKAGAAKRIAKLSTEQQRDLMANNGHGISVKDVVKAEGKPSKPSFRAVREYVEPHTGPGEDESVREFCKGLLEFMDGKG